MFSEEFRQWSASAFREGVSARLDCIVLIGGTPSPPSIVGLGQRCADQPDQRVSQAQEGNGLDLHNISAKLASENGLPKDTISEGTYSQRQLFS